MKDPNSLHRWTKRELMNEVMRMRRQAGQIPPLPAPRRPAVGQPFSITHLLGAFFGDQAFAAPGREGPPLWLCRTCRISVGEWNPALERVPLYCPRCRQPLTIHGQRIADDGAISVTFEPIIEAPRAALLIDPPKGK